MAFFQQPPQLGGAVGNELVSLQEPVHRPEPEPVAHEADAGSSRPGRPEIDRRVADHYGVAGPGMRERHEVSQSRGIGFPPVWRVAANDPLEERSNPESFENALGGMLRLVREDRKGRAHRERVERLARPVVEARVHQQPLVWGMKKNVELVQLADNFNYLRWVVVK